MRPDNLSEDTIQHNKQRNTILFGFGPHAKRIYFNLLKENNIPLHILVDLKSKKEELSNISDLNNIDLFLVDDSEKDNRELSVSNYKKLQKKCIKYNINYAIISTEPKSHFAYIKFCLENNINILIDKPLTVPTNFNDLNWYKELYKDYMYINNLYKGKNLKFYIMCQRRAHNGFLMAFDILKEAIEQYNIPITYLDIYHSDGVLNMPVDFINRENHPYKYGYGKLFHSGFHFVDMLSEFLTLNNNTDRLINNAEINTTVLRPSDFLYQINNDNFIKLFNVDYNNELKNDFSRYGELDIYSNIDLKYNDKIVTHINLDLLQSGFSKKNSSVLPFDTYKSNGRVRHERYNIHLGAFLNLQIHSYQSYEINDKSILQKDEVGGIEHFDIYVFRNKLLGGEEFKRYTVNDIYKDNPVNFLGHNEEARANIFKSFYGINNNYYRCNLEDFRLSIKLLEYIGESMVKKRVEREINIENNIALITDKDILGTEATNFNFKTIRYGSRGIIIKDNKIGLFYKTNKNEYKLPGGGIEKDETPLEAFIREVKEETGCQIEDVKKIGIIEEEKNKNSFKQISYVFEANVTEIGDSDITEKEKEEGAKFLFVEIDEALDLMKNCYNNLIPSKYDDIYSTKFMILRDIKILEYYLRMNKNKY